MMPPRPREEETWSFEHAMIVRRIPATDPAALRPELVWIHGLGEWSVNFDPIARHPALSAFSHTLPDLPGYGRSPWPATEDRTEAGADRSANRGDSLDDLADVLVSMLRSRPPAVLIGHSMGGVLANLIGEQIKVAGIVNFDGNLSRDDCTFSARAATYAVEDFVDRGLAEMRADVYARGVTEPALRGYHAALSAASPRIFHRNATDLVRLSSTEALAPRLAALDVPVLVIAGVPGGLCEHSRTLLDRHEIRWIGLEPAGHWVHLDQLDRCATVLADFLGNLPASPATLPASAPSLRP